jgi:hypothetical protein
MEKMLGHDQLHASGSGLNRPALSSCMANFGELAGAANCSAERPGNALAHVADERGGEHYKTRHDHDIRNHHKA